jgi:hypothetical protein
MLYCHIVQLKITGKPSWIKLKGAVVENSKAQVKNQPQKFS